MSGPNGSTIHPTKKQLQKIGEAEIANIADQSNLTRSQFLMWLGQSVAPEIPLYNMIFTFIFEGEIDPRAFQTAFQIIVDQNDALRLIIDEKEGVPQQRVLDSLPYEVDYLDFSTETDPRATLQQWLEQRQVDPGRRRQSAL